MAITWHYRMNTFCGKMIESARWRDPACEKHMTPEYVCQISRGLKTENNRGRILCTDGGPLLSIHISEYMPR